MADPVIVQSRQSQQRTAPGNGATLPDCGTPGDKHIKIRSIPNVPTARLLRRAEYLHHQLANPEALHAFDMPRRTLIHYGVNLQAIRHELSLR